MLFAVPVAAHAEAGYKANYWSSWASVSNSKIKWTFPYNSREITIMNGSSVPVCISFNNNSFINNTCTTSVPNQVSTGDNKVFQIAANQNVTLRDFQQQAVNLISATGAAASPVSVIVAY